MNQTCHTLSIIIPAYNEEKTIAELLQRVLDADLGESIDRELIVWELSPDHLIASFYYRLSNIRLYGSDISICQCTGPFNLGDRSDNFRITMKFRVTDVTQVQTT